MGEEEQCRAMMDRRWLRRCCLCEGKRNSFPIVADVGTYRILASTSDMW